VVEVSLVVPVVAGSLSLLEVAAVVVGSPVPGSPLLALLLVLVELLLEEDSSPGSGVQAARTSSARGMVRR
jgi:hypothetical protein